MASPDTSRRDAPSRFCATCFSVAAITLTTFSGLSTQAQAQSCVPDLPAPDQVFVDNAADGRKFRLIEQACPVLGTPTLPRHAAQLDLYDTDDPSTVAGNGATVAFASVVSPGPSLGPRKRSLRIDLTASTNGAFGSSVRPAEIPATNRKRPGERSNRVLALAPAMINVARDNGLDPLLLHAIAHVESRHNPRAVSPAGARGLMQVMPATGRRFGVANEKSLLDAGTNLRASAAYLRTLMLRYHDDLPLVLAAYNAGEGAVDKAGGRVPPYKETQAYVRDVQAIYRRLSARFTIAASGELLAVGQAPEARR